MAVVHEFKYTVAPEGQWIELDDWVATLPVEQQTEFHDAVRRQREYRSQAIAEGRLVVDDSHLGADRKPGDQPVYIWKDPEAAKQNKSEDAIWRGYFNRWLAENQITITVEERII
jgi:hypothetical protein